MRPIILYGKYAFEEPWEGVWIHSIQGVIKLVLKTNLV